MKTIHVSTGSPYDIMIERGILDNCGEIIKKLSNAEKIPITSRDPKKNAFFIRLPLLSRDATMSKTPKE